LKWADSQKKTSQIVINQADEEGNFKLTVMESGPYILLASGHAGFDDARWVKHFSIQPGAEASLKLSVPEKACVATR
jgi:hypothetical protein